MINNPAQITQLDCGCQIEIDVVQLFPGLPFLFNLFRAEPLVIATMAGVGSSVSGLTKLPEMVTPLD